MTDPFRERRYRIAEARSVVRSALTHEADPDGGRALTQDELSRMLADLGVSAETAAQSIEQVDVRIAESAPDEKSWLGGPSRIVLEGEVPGELADDRREDVVEVIRETIGDTGRVETLGRTVTWAPSVALNNQQRRLSVKIRVRDGRTKIRVDEDMSGVRAGAWVGFGMGGGLGLGWLGLAVGKAARSVPLAIVTYLAILLASLIAAYLTTRRVTNKRRDELRTLFDKVRDEVARGCSLPQPTAEKGSPRARVAETQAQSSAPREALAEQEELAEEEAARALRGQSRS